jgi:hypothetical protein
MKKFQIILIILILILTYGCSSAVNIPWVRYSVQAGLNKGGVVENTIMEDIPGAGVDAFSGATRTGFHGGAKIAVGKIVALQAGTDYMYNNQVFTYNDPANGFSGQRNLNTHQFMFPTTLNFRLLSDKVEFKVGHVLQYNMMGVKSQGTLPHWSINKWSNGATMGIAISPLRFENGSRIGLYLEGYRGGQIYDDHYNQTNFEMPGSSFFKYGIIYHF